MMTKLATLFLLLCAVTATAQDACVPCEGDVDPTLSFDDIPCTEWLTVAGSAPANSSQCTFDRMVGVWFCGCSVPKSAKGEECTLCQDGSTDFNTRKTFPDSAVTCSDISSIPALDGDLTCNELRQMAGYCECPVSDATCDLCPNSDGGSPTNLDGVFLTTGETCQYVKEVLQISPASNCNAYLPDLMVDVESFCGCPGAEAPNSCSMCPAGSKVVDSSKPLQAIPGTTCGEFDVYASFVTDDQLCEYMQEVIAMECCDALASIVDDEETFSFDCTFCPDGNSIISPDQELIGINATCGELANRKREDNSTDCPSLYQTELDMLIDTGVYCGCPKIDTTGVCPFCPEGQDLLDPKQLVTEGVNVENATCGEYSALADAAFDKDFCDAVRGVGELNGCCGVPTSVSTADNVTEIVATLDEDVTDTSTLGEFCDLCGPGVNVQDEEKMFLGTTVTCQEYHAELAAIPQGNQCDGIVAEFTTTFDPKIFCNCPGSEATGECPLCPVGSEVVDPTIWISDMFTTCGQINDIAKATSNQEFCSSLQQIGKFYCCQSHGTTVEDGKRNLKAEPTSTALMPFHRSTYQFAKLKAVNSVRDAVSNLAGKTASFDIHSGHR